MSRACCQLVRPGFLLALLIAVGGGYFVLEWLPSLVGVRRAKMPLVISNLKQIEIAKQLWAADRAATNGVAVFESDLMEYLPSRPGSTGLVDSVDGEVYKPNAIGTPAEARLVKPLGRRFPRGTLVRCGLNAREFEVDIFLPNQPVEATQPRPEVSHDQ